MNLVDICRRFTRSNDLDKIKNLNNYNSIKGRFQVCFQSDQRWDYFLIIKDNESQLEVWDDGSNDYQILKIAIIDPCIIDYTAILFNSQKDFPFEIAESFQEYIKKDFPINYYHQETFYAFENYDLLDLIDTIYPYSNK